MHGTIALFVVITILRLAYSDYESTIFIFSSNSSQCSSPAVHIDNFTLQNSTEIEFCEAVVGLNRTLTVKNKAHIKLSGGTIFTCLNSAGFVFEHVENLTILGITIINCGVVYHGSAFLNQTSVFLLNCALVNIVNVSALNSVDVDLYMLNSREVTITESKFSRKRINSNVVPKSRVRVNFENVLPNYLFTKSNNIVFVNCTFGDESLVFKGVKDCSRTHSKEEEVGGGLVVVLGQNATNISVKIQNCTFQNFYTSHGLGGLYVLLTGDAHENTISVEDSEFVNNSCFKCGGGGMRIDFLNDKPFLGNNKISLFRSNFTGNCAKHGGGVFVNYQKPSICQLSNSIEFNSCNWTDNIARFGSAMDATAKSSAGKYYPKTTLKNCTFRRNRVQAVVIHNKVTVFGQGTVSAINFPLNFEGNTSFTDNVGSPLYLSSSNADFSTNSTNTFMRNTGLNGGAVTLLGTSAIRAKPGSIFVFRENRAYFKGGAIYHKTIDGHVYLTSTNCFIQFIEDQPAHEKPRYIFTNNEAGTAFNKNDSLGKSIYVTTLYPCEKICGYRGRHYRADNSTMACVGIFEYNNTIRRFEVATSEWFMSVTKNGSLLKVIPGKEIKLPVETTDELGQELDAVYKVTLWHNYSTNTEPWILPAYRYIHNNKIALRGKPSTDKLVLALTTVHNREVRLQIDVNIVPCPPGYILDEQSLVCRCSADLDPKYRYHGVTRCDSTAFQAKLQSGYWVGYSNGSYHSLIGSVCPRGFCVVFSNSTTIQKDIALPDSFDITALDTLLCGNHRTGKLCAKCRDNKSVYYNSNSYWCKENRLCEVGWLFFGITELLPVTSIFLAVTVFDIKLTSGSTFGLILYYQLLSTMLMNANNIIKMSHLTYQFSKFHRLLSQMFNLNFFVHETMSFCLWKGATALDVIAFKYFTVVYALLMVLLTILIIKTCNHTYFCLKLRKATRRKQVTNSVIHGISGFFILCYSECIRVSLLLLKPIKYEDPSNSLNNTRYVLYDGEMKYFEGAHLKYAIPALFFLTTIIFAPPMLLIAYPLCYKILALFGLQESKCSQMLCVIIPLEKMKPFFDSFQGSFKDKHRYTSGLYFVYRLIAVSLAVFTTYNISLFYTLLEILLLVMIFVLAYCQPHKKSKHNRQDLFVFVVLAAVNALTFYSFKKSVDVVDEQYTVYIATTVQTFLLYIPTMYVAMRAVLFLIRIARSCCIKTSSEVKYDDTELLEGERVEDCEESNSEHQYKKMLDEPQYT